MVIRIGDRDITLELHSTSSSMFDMHICEISTGLGDVGYLICNPLFGIIYEPSHNGKTNSQIEIHRERELQISQYPPKKKHPPKLKSLRILRDPSPLLSS
jgi:hypothetical protein